MTKPNYDNKINVEVFVRKIDNESFSVTQQVGDILNEYTKIIVDLKEKAIREGLISLGWSPPGVEGLPVEFAQAFKIQYDVLRSCMTAIAKESGVTDWAALSSEVSGALARHDRFYKSVCARLQAEEKDNAT